ncbi:hypothetical protein BDZ89DRAFT_1054645 [Hymenopellis radicata]|nr:hypothetical protein BDZ89DRAFT_1054645 [Hymenopellis radicata]
MKETPSILRTRSRWYHDHQSRGGYSAHRPSLKRGANAYPSEYGGGLGEDTRSGNVERGEALLSSPSHQHEAKWEKDASRRQRLHMADDVKESIHSLDLCRIVRNGVVKGAQENIPSKLNASSRRPARRLTKGWLIAVSEETGGENWARMSSMSR